MTTNILSKYTSASVRELFILTTPIFFSLLSSNLMLFCDRYFLSRYSFEAFSAVGVANYLVILFQIACIRFASINQVFIGRNLGDGNTQKIGQYTWQMIWASLFTSILVIPMGNISGQLYFADTEVKSLGESYFSIMIFGNFLFPLGTTLASFQIGIGRTKILPLVALIANLFNVILDYYLINGISGVLHPLGVKGAAIATLASQVIYCSMLFFLFINNRNEKEYKTRDFEFRPSIFKECVKVGALGAFSRSVSLFFWTLSMNIVARKGGDYVTIISFGSTICILTSIINESVSKGLIAFYSYFLGQGNWMLVWKSLRSGIILLFMAFLLLAFPFLSYNRYLVEIIIGSKVIDATTMNFLTLSCYWLWIFFLLEGIAFSFTSLVVAMKETAYLAKAVIPLTFLSTYLPYYLSFNVWSFRPDKIWMVAWICFIIVPSTHIFKIIRSYSKSQKTLLSKESNLFV